MGSPRKSARDSALPGRSRASHRSMAKERSLSAPVGGLPQVAPQDYTLRTKGEPKACAVQRVRICLDNGIYSQNYCSCGKFNMSILQYVVSVKVISTNCQKLLTVLWSF